jgi:hypothetical protein
LPLSGLWLLRTALPVSRQSQDGRKETEKEFSGHVA